jgi:hypothetical protein
MDTVPPVASPLRQATEGTVRPPQVLIINNTAKSTVQDEPFLRSRTLYLYLRFELIWLIYAI